MKATRELGEVRITVCRSRLASDRGEMERARFLVNLTALRGGGKSGAGQETREIDMIKWHAFQCTQPMRPNSKKKRHVTLLCPVDPICDLLIML